MNRLRRTLLGLGLRRSAAGRRPDLDAGARRRRHSIPRPARPRRNPQIARTQSSSRLEPDPHAGRRRSRARPGGQSARPSCPLTEGPLHEAFLSPAKDARAGIHRQGPARARSTSGPGVDPPERQGAHGSRATGSGTPAQNDYVWVTGTWRSPAAGPVLGQRLLEARRQGLVSRPRLLERPPDRPDRLAEERPARRASRRTTPARRPATTTSTSPATTPPTATASSGSKGFWAKAQPGWSWVPAQWVRQPEGWTFQDGYWDRTLEDRGTLFAPAQVADARPSNGDTSISRSPRSLPSSTASSTAPSAGRTPTMTAIPAVYYDNNGRYYGYANYGKLSTYYGYLDYPYTGAYGYPYLSGYGIPRYQPALGVEPRSSAS